MKIDNYKVLFGLKLFKSILQSFVDSFLVLYFLTLSNSNIIPLATYKIVAMFVVFITIFLLRNICKSKYRIHLLRIGIILDFVYFLSLIILKEKVINYIYVVGILYGLEEGVYFSVYNMFESDGVSNKERAKFMGYYSALSSILAILFPIIFGSLIKGTGFINTVIVVLVIVLIRIILSFLFKDSNMPSSNKTNLKEYTKIVKNSKEIRGLYKVYFYTGLTYSEGAFQSIITIYIIKVFSDSFSLGIFTSIFSLISCLIGILFVKMLKEDKYSKLIGISMLFTIVSLIVMVVHCNAITIILFNFFQTISKKLRNLINEKSEYDLANLKEVKKEYKVEYFLGNEFFLFLGRTISQLIFILMAFVNPLYIIPIFVVFLIMLTISSVKLQRVINS